jgi:hypothetical protein
VIGVGIGIGTKKIADIIDDAREWGDTRERQKERKRRAREDEMTHKQKDARNYY